MVPNHALVFGKLLRDQVNETAYLHRPGASGITGWAITNLIIQGYPTPETFGSVTALTNRPLSREAAQWPESSKLDVISGINIMTEKGQSGFEDELKAKVKHINEITHVYFFGMSHPRVYDQR